MNWWVTRDVAWLSGSGQGFGRWEVYLGDERNGNESGMRVQQDESEIKWRSMRCSFVLCHGKETRMSSSLRDK